MTYQKALEYLNAGINKDLLPHAFIFYGPDEIGKQKIISNFVDSILDTAADFKPDLISISADANEELTISLIRQLKKFLVLKPYSGGYKVAVVKNAEKLNSYAQNALLKIFEEAPSYAIIIICVRMLGLISETLASRGVKLAFWTQNNNLETKFPSDIAETFEKMLNGGFKNPYRAVEKFYNREAIEIFKMWLEFLRIKFLREHSRELSDLLRISQNIYFKLNESNINPKFAYDELVLNLWKS